MAARAASIVGLIKAEISGRCPKFVSLLKNKIFVSYQIPLKQDKIAKAFRNLRKK